MKLSVIKKTGCYCGDHTAEVSLAFDAVESETIGSLVKRTKLGQNNWFDGEVLEIRVTVEPSTPPAI
jgi:hypothetical protein